MSGSATTTPSSPISVAVRPASGAGSETIATSSRSRRSASTAARGHSSSTVMSTSGCAAAKRRSARRTAIGRTSGGRADAQPRQRAGARALGGPARILGEPQHAAGLLEQRSARGRQRDRALRALEQLHAELALEVADLLADGGLGDVQPLGGAAKVQFLRDGDEVSEVAQFHAVHGLTRRPT